MKNPMRCAAMAGLAFLATALPAAAHPGHGAGTGLAAGLLHPLTGVDHLLALLALGMWSRRQLRGVVLPPVFLVLMALGASCAGALADAMLPALEMSIAATVLLLGVLAAAALRLPPQAAVALAALCGFLHGMAHGRELTGADSGAGFLLASALLMGVGTSLSLLAGLVRTRLGQADRRRVSREFRLHTGVGGGDGGHVGRFVAGQHQGLGNVDDLAAVVD
jgi:urease accessory protein